MKKGPQIIASLLLGLSGISTQAQTRDVITQTPHNLGNQNVPITTYNQPGTIPSLSEILSNFHGSYSVSLMGPRFDGSSNETYNLYIPDVSALQLYHELKLGYQVNQDLQIGVDESIVQNVVDGVHGITGYVYNKTWDYYDPMIYFNLPNLIQIPGWFVSTTASFSLPVSSAAIAQAKVTSITIDQAWNVNTYPSKWFYGFHTFINPQFYNDPLPDGYTNRQTFLFTFGHNLGYQVSDLFSITTTTNFDVEHRAPDPKGFAHLGDGLPDYAQIAFSITPNIYPGFISFGGYVQCLIWEPSTASSIIGGKFSVGF